jgi:hypothetical protein
MMQGDPLAQLRDIHLPDPVSAWPPGPGWWVLAALLLMLIAALLWWIVRRHRDNGWRRQAADELGQAYSQWQRQGDPRRYLQQLNEILKRAALHQYPGELIAGLSGAAWSRFLDAHWQRPPQQGFDSLGLADLVYRPDSHHADIETLHRLGTRWLNESRRST